MINQYKVILDNEMFLINVNNIDQNQNNCMTQQQL